MGAIRKYTVIVFPYRRLGMNRDINSTHSAPSRKLRVKAADRCVILVLCLAQCPVLQQTFPSFQKPGFSLGGTKICFSIASA